MREARLGHGATLLGPDRAGLRVLMSPLDTATTLLLVSDRAYFVYVGCMTEVVVPRFVCCHVSTAGAGGQTAELGIFSSTAAPNKAALSLSKLEATGTIGDLTGTGFIRNTGAFSTVVPKGTHLWAGMRTAMATTQPTMVALRLDMGVGFVQTTSTAGALTDAGPWTGAIAAATLLGVGPDLRVEAEVF